MACGYAKYTGKLRVCVATSGPGGIHLLNGLYDAKLEKNCSQAGGSRMPRGCQDVDNA
jgi:glyoxylate carboligase